jgi:hypothetical protein
MLNLAGPSYDFGNVLFAVLQECEHRRRTFLPNEARAGLMRIAEQKLAAVKASYVEQGGSDGYWKDLHDEVLQTAMPQYIEGAVAQTELEKCGYDLWRGGDLLARVVFALIGVTVGGIIVALPFIPIFEDAFAFGLALFAWFYPDLKRLLANARHARRMNRLITDGVKYQRNQRIHYVSSAEMDEALEALASPKAIDEGTRALTGDGEKRSS